MGRGSGPGVVGVALTGCDLSPAGDSVSQNIVCEHGEPPELSWLPHTSPCRRARPVLAYAGVPGSASGCVLSIRRVAPGQELVAVPEAVPVAVDADAHAGAGRHAGVRHGVARVRGQGPQRRLLDGGSPRRSRLKKPAPTYTKPASTPESSALAIRSHSPASARWRRRWTRGATAAELDAVSVICWPTIGREVGGKRQQERSSCRRWTRPRGPSGSPLPTPVEFSEEARRGEAEHRIEFPSWRNPKPRTWSPLKSLSTPGDPGSNATRTEHADLLIQVAEVRDLERAAGSSKLAARRCRRSPGIAAELARCRPDRGTWQHWQVITRRVAES